MSWCGPYVPYPYFPGPYLPVMDPAYMMWYMWSWVASYYYLALSVEAYKAFIEAWRKSFEALTKMYESVGPITTSK